MEVKRCVPRIRSYWLVRESAKAELAAKAQFDKHMIAARNFAQHPSQQSLVKLINGSLGADAAADYLLYLARKTATAKAATASRLDVRYSAQPIEFACHFAIAHSIAAKAGQKAAPVRLEITAYNGGPMSIGGYSSQVVIDISGVDGLGKAIPILRDHDSKRIVGHGIAHAEAAFSRLGLKGQLYFESKDAREVVDSCKNGFPWQASVGLQPHTLQEVFEGESTYVNGREQFGPLIIAREGKLREVSIVAMGADDTTSTRVAALNRATTAADLVTVAAAQCDQAPRHKRELGRDRDAAKVGH